MLIAETRSIQKKNEQKYPSMQAQLKPISNRKMPMATRCPISKASTLYGPNTKSSMSLATNPKRVTVIMSVWKVHLC